MSCLAETFLEAHDNEITDLSRKFSSYFTSIDRNDVRIWLKQFDLDHLPIALKLLKAVDFYDPPRITYNYRTAHRQLLATLNTTSLGDVIFFPFGHAGKSGSSMSYFYRNANDIHHRKFRYFSEIPSLFRGFREKTKTEYKLVFIDDFIATGSQAIETWERLSEIPFPSEARAFLVALVGFDRAIDEVTQNTDLQVVTPKILSEEDRAFSPMNTFFTNNEKEVLRSYCERVGQAPSGYLNCQALVVFNYKAPDDIISILRAPAEHWKPLFPRAVLQTP